MVKGVRSDRESGWKGGGEGQHLSFPLLSSGNGADVEESLERETDTQSCG